MVVAISRRLLASHDVMQQQHTLYEFTRKIWGMRFLRVYNFLRVCNYKYPTNQALIPSLRGEEHAWDNNLFAVHHQSLKPTIDGVAVRLLSQRPTILAVA